MRFWHVILALIALWAVLYLPGLGGPELKGEEGRRILPGLEMRRSGEWIVPYMEGQPYLRKPPLINWAVAASVAMTGRVNEFTARLPSAVAVLALALAGGLLGAGLVAGEGAPPQERAKAALLIGVALLAHVGLWNKGRLAEIEALYVALTGIALALWMEAWRREVSPWLTWTVPWLVLGLGWLCKGPPHLFFFYGIVLVALWKGRSLRELWHPAHFLGVALMLAVFLPWALAAKSRVAAVAPKVKVGATWWKQLVERFDLEYFRLTDWLLTPFEAVVMWLPWSVALLLWGRHLPELVRRRPGRDGALLYGLWWGGAWVAGAVLLVPTVRDRFLQPLTLPLVVVAAVLLWQAASERARAYWTRGTLGLAVVVAVAGVIVPWLPGVGAGSLLGAALASLATLMVVLGLGRLWLKFSRLIQPMRLVLATAVAAALFTAVFAISIVPAMRTRDNMRPVGRLLSQAVGREHLYILNPGKTPPPLHWRFYLTCPHTVINEWEEIPPEALFLLLPERCLDEEKERVRLKEKFGFHHEVLQVTDSLNKEHTLFARHLPGVETLRIQMPAR